MKIEFENIRVPSLADVEEQRTWIAEESAKIGQEKIGKLAELASIARLMAYAPYSHFKVGAAVLCVSGKMYAACNAEAISWTQTDHAETGAVRKAISAGEALEDREFIEAVAISTETDGTNKAVGPCGNCLQVIAEHATNCLTIDVNERAEIMAISSLKVLFPYGFSPSTEKFMDRGLGEKRTIITPEGGKK